MRKFLVKNWGIWGILGFSILTIWPLLRPGYFSHHDDLQVIRIFEMRKCLVDFQIPCRWVPDMGYGFGYPLFNYYNPFVYYLGAVISYVSGFVWSAKILFMTALILGPIAMYFLGKELWGKLGGFVSTIVFMFAPYRALDAYVRGALAELFAISLIPLLFLFILRLIKQGKKLDFFALTLLIGVFLTTHNISVILWFPFVFFWTLFWLYKSKFMNIKLLLTSLLLGFGLSAFFTLPAYLEKDLVTSETLISGDLDYHVHFSGIKQLFLDRFWGYGASKLGPNDDLSMQIGWPHWWIVILGVLSVLYFKGRSFKGYYSLPLLLATFFLVSIFMTHNKSTPVWESIGILKYLQFPWRFLAVSVFSASLLGGFVTSVINGKYKYYLAAVLIFLAVVLNWSYFRPEKFYFDVDDQKKLSGELWEEQQRGAIFDYLPTTSELRPGMPLEKALDEVIYLNFDPKMPYEDYAPKVVDILRTSKSWLVEIDTLKNAEMNIPVFDFPTWEVEVDGMRVKTNHDNFLGTIKFSIQPGKHLIHGYFKDTSVRSVANLLTLISFGILLFLWKYGKSRKIIS